MAYVTKLYELNPELVQILDKNYLNSIKCNQGFDEIVVNTINPFYKDDPEHTPFDHKGEKLYRELEHIRVKNWFIYTQKLLALEGHCSDRSIHRYTDAGMPRLKIKIPGTNKREKYYVGAHCNIWHNVNKDGNLGFVED